MVNDIQKLFPGWEIVRMIGRGSFGVVYEIQRKIIEHTERAALKVISIPQNKSDIEELYGDGYDDESITSTFQSHLKSIVDEYMTMRKLKECTNIVYCEDVKYIKHEDDIGWDIFIKMELLTPLTKSLPDVIQENMVIKVAQDMCRALVACNNNKIVHRDIKPQNIFISERGEYKLGDFGIAKTVEKTMGGTKIGTYKYMAPEVYNNQPYGSGADIYSLGLVLYWMLNERRLPFLPLPPAKIGAGADEEARSRRFSGEQIPAPKYGSDALKRIVLRACAFEPGMRYQSAADMLQELECLWGVSWEKKKFEEEERRQKELEEQEKLRIVRERQEQYRKEREEKERLQKEMEEKERIRKEEEERKNKKLKEQDEIPKKRQYTGKAKKAEGNKEPKKKRKIYCVIIACIMCVIVSCVIGQFIGKNTGWQIVNNESFYYRDGVMQTGWQSIDEKKYFFNDEGKMQTGLQVIDGREYFFGDDGVMQVSSLINIKDSTYYFGNDGAKQTGWREIDGITYYFKKSGEMCTGWQKIDTKKYYFDDSGALHKGWLKKDGKSFYLAPSKDGAMAVGKWKIDDDFYYFYDTGVMARGEVEIADNEIGYFDSNGKLEYCESIRKSIASTWSEDKVELLAADGGKNTDYFKELNLIVRDCIYLEFDYQFTEVDSGDPYGNWLVSIRDLDGEWIPLGYFEMTNDIDQDTHFITLDDPVSFDAIAVSYYENNPKAYKVSRTLKVLEVRCKKEEFSVYQQ